MIDKNVFVVWKRTRTHQWNVRAEHVRQPI